jgi:hypothetical protein
MGGCHIAPDAPVMVLDPHSFELSGNVSSSLKKQTGYPIEISPLLALS